MQNVLAAMNGLFEHWYFYTSNYCIVDPACFALIINTIGDELNIIRVRMSVPKLLNVVIVKKDKLPLTPSLIEKALSV